MDVGFWFGSKFKNERIPSVEDVLNLENIRFYIELKDGSPVYPNIEENLVDMINGLGVKRRCVVISFDHDAVHKVKELDRKMRTGKLFIMKLSGTWDSLCENTDYLCPFWPSIDYGFVEEAHKRKKKVNTWTVNNVQAMRYVIGCGVDSITTDVVDVCVALREEYGHRKRH